METEIIDRLFLELSQVTRAMTAKEARLIAERDEMCNLASAANCSNASLEQTVRDLRADNERLAGALEGVTQSLVELQCAIPPTIDVDEAMHYANLSLTAARTALAAHKEGGKA